MFDSREICRRFQVLAAHRRWFLAEDIDLLVGKVTAQLGRE
jgi:hypothetical protein